MGLEKKTTWQLQTSPHCTLQVFLIFFMHSSQSMAEVVSRCEWLGWRRREPDEKED